MKTPHKGLSGVEWGWVELREGNGLVREDWSSMKSHFQAPFPGTTVGSSQLHKACDTANRNTWKVLFFITIWSHSLGQHERRRRTQNMIYHMMHKMHSHKHRGEGWRCSEITIIVRPSGDCCRVSLIVQHPPAPQWLLTSSGPVRYARVSFWNQRQRCPAALPLRRPRSPDTIE